MAEAKRWISERASYSTPPMGPSQPTQGFLTVILIARIQPKRLMTALGELGALVRPWVADYELVVVDNASDDHNVARLKELTGEGGRLNLQVYALSKQVDADRPPGWALKTPWATTWRCSI
jgi:hypothetical protein